MSFFVKGGKETEDALDPVALLVRPERRNPSVFGPEGLCLGRHHRNSEDLVPPVCIDRQGHRNDAPSLSPLYVGCVEPDKRALTAPFIPRAMGNSIHALGKTRPTPGI